MRKILTDILKTAIPFGLGCFLIWLVVKNLTPQDIEDIKTSFKEINYWIILFSIFLAVLSHMSRAWRWKYPLNELGYHPKFMNSFFTVMIGYFINLGIPRSGEVARCGFMAKYENIPLSKLIGTVIAERVADLLILVGFIATILFLQFELIKNYLTGLEIWKTYSLSKLLPIALVSLLLLGIFLFFLLKKSNHNLLLRVKTFLLEIIEGIVVIVKMKGRWLFIAHTFFIWLMYFLMLYVTFFSLPGVQSVPIEGILTAFVIGGISIAATNGGIGAYPLGISAVLVLYDVNPNTGYAFGWAVWTAQTIMVLTLGLTSLILLPKFNSQKKG